MRICYLDESGVAELTGGTSHFVFLGLTIPAETWGAKDAEITRVKQRFGLRGAEIHAAWMARRFPEQEQIAGFELLSEPDRRAAVLAARDRHLINKAAVKGLAAVQEDRKNFRKTAAYVHLTRAERVEALRQIADGVGAWADCVIFADCIDKTSFRGLPPVTPPYEEAFTQVVTRFHRFLTDQVPQDIGLLVEDRNETMARRLTDLMRTFQARGTRWTAQIDRIIETPLFVDSGLTSIVQVADLCAYAARRFFEQGERDLFDRIVGRFHTVGGRLVGVRHYTGTRRCVCHVCQRH